VAIKGAASLEVERRLDSPSVSDAKPYRYRLKPGEAETMRLTPAMSRVVDLSVASQAELNQVNVAKSIERTQVHPRCTLRERS